MVYVWSGCVSYTTLQLSVTTVTRLLPADNLPAKQQGSMYRRSSLMVLLFRLWWIMDAQLSMNCFQCNIPMSTSSSWLNIAIVGCDFCYFLILWTSLCGSINHWMKNVLQAMNRLIDKSTECRTLPLSRILWSVCENSRDLLKICFEVGHHTLMYCLTSSSWPRHIGTDCWRNHLPFSVPKPCKATPLDSVTWSSTIYEAHLVDLHCTAQEQMSRTWRIPSAHIAQILLRFWS